MLETKTEKLKYCCDLIRKMIESGYSLTLSKTKAFRMLDMQPSDSPALSELKEYQQLRKEYLTQHRRDKSWTAKLIK